MCEEAMRELRREVVARASVPGAGASCQGEHPLARRVARGGSPCERAHGTSMCAPQLPACVGRCARAGETETVAAGDVCACAPLILAALERVERVHRALHLRRARARVEAQRAVIQSLLQVGDGLAPHVLQRVLEAGDEVRQVAVERALVRNIARHALCDLHLVTHREVAVGAAALRVHRVERAHPAVLLEPDTILVDVLAWRLLGAREHRAHHHARSARSERLADLPHVADTAVGDDGNTKVAREARHLVHRGRLRPATRHHLLRRADRARAHAHAQRVRAPLNQVARLLHSHHVARDHLNRVVVSRLDVLDHVALERRVTLRRVDDDHVHTLLDETAHALTIALARVD
mmetsp:Transcript_9414/g.24380  ORF Transcript_9414/g.24380 Transcript_9414/m.24380 type:complete len:350 (+) Transcript_9414:98-1147(+)